MVTRELASTKAHTYPANRPICIGPGIMNTPAWANQVAKRLVPALHELEKSPLAASSGFVGVGRFLNMPGYAGDPYSLPNINPDLARVQLSDDFAGIAMLVSSVLFEDYTKHICERPLDIRKEANSGAPDYILDPLEKTRYIKHLFAHIADIRKHIEAKDMEYLYRVYKMSSIVTVGRRNQTDAVELEWIDDVQFKAMPKEREAIIDYDPQSGKPVKVTINKSLAHISDGKGNHFPENVFACRNRPVLAVSIGNNCFLMVVGNAIFDSFVPKYPLTYHVADPYMHMKSRVVRDKLDGRNLISFDFKEFDHSIPAAALLYFLLGLRQAGVPEWLTTLAELTFTGPVLCGGLYHDKRDKSPHFFGNPRDPWNPMYQIHCGLTSGNAFTSLFAKWFVTCLLVTAFVRLHLLKPTRNDVIKYLSWDVSIPVFNMNMGDDNVLAPLASVQDKIMEQLPKIITAICPTMRITWDDHPQFISHMFVRNVNGYYDAMPDPVRAGCNEACPENGFHIIYANQKASYNVEQIYNYMGVTGDASKDFLSATRKFPAFGRAQRHALYSERSPVWKAYRAIWDDVANDFNPYYTRAMHQLEEVETTALSRLNVEATNYVELEFLQNPEKVYYKFSRDQIRDSLFNVHFISFDDIKLKEMKHHFVA